jgi:hypothetical protein
VNQREAFELLLSNRLLFKETLMLVESKDRQRVPYKLNPIQLDVNLTRTGRDVYVKPAQVGFSTDIICDYLIDCVTIPGTTAVIISYDEFITGRLLRKAHYFYRVLKERIPTLDKLNHKSTYEMTFEKLNSSFFISSAQSFTGVRGETIHRLFLDEFAFWPPGDAERVWASALQRVPLSGDSTVDIGSTPNGEGNEFYEVYMAAREGKEVGKSIFTPHFYPWYIHPEYRMPAESQFILTGDDVTPLRNVQPDEEKLLRIFESLGYDELKAYDLLRWRRYKQAEMSSLQRSGTTRLLFSQEFPEDDVSCFLAAGDAAYDSQLLANMAGDCFPAPLRWNRADVWEEPKDGVNYLIAVDPGVGKHSDSVATVWDFSSEEEFNHVATLGGLYDGPEMADMVKLLAVHYNNAIVANEDALEFNNFIKDYGNLYYRTDIESGKVYNKIGWLTSPKTKPFMIAELNRNLQKIRTHDIRLVSQCRNIRWVQGARGQRAVAVGADDYHDSLAIAICTRSSAPVERGLVGTYGWKDSW